jgi:hypothetical protein
MTRDAKQILLKNKLAARICSGFATVFLLLLSLPAETQSNLYDKSSLDQRFDFVIEVQTQILKNYMGYTGSTLYPITQLRVSYRETPRSTNSQVSTSVLYEDLWYHNCQAIGCRRYNLFQIKPGEQGCIHFLTSSDTTGAGCPIANATTRLLLDIGLNNSALASVIVPVDAVNSVVSQFEQFNFHSYVPKPDVGVKATMNLFVCSEPVGVKQYLYYDGGN